MSDGALTDMVSAYSMSYAESFPDEFYDRYSCEDSFKLNCQQFTTVVDLIQNEIDMGENKEEETKTFLQKMETKKHKYPSDPLSIILVDRISKGLN